MRNNAAFNFCADCLSSVIAAVKVSFMPRFLALTIEHKLDDLISFCVSAVVLAAAQILQESSRCFEFIARFASLLRCQTSNMFLLQTCKALYWSIGSVAKPTLSVREVWGSIPGPIKSSESRQRLAIVATFVWSYVAQTRRWAPATRYTLRCITASIRKI